MHALKSNSLGSAPESDQGPLVTAVTELDPINGWTVYRRLQDLGITCRYGRDSPSDPFRNRLLTVAIHTPTDALLVWSVVQSTTQTKPSLVDHLDRCWQQRSPR
jgi:hypothetical protein